MIRLESLASCFQGLIPGTLHTCSRSGIPNVAVLSHVDYVDSTHVALSFQFFNKSKANISENPNALVHVNDPDTGGGWGLRLRYVRTETSGPVFDRMFLRIEAIASYSGLKGIFKLKAADIYEVESVELVPEQAGVTERWSPRSRARQENPVFTMKALQEMSSRINTADSLEGLLESILSGLKEHFGFSHSMILLAGEKPNTVVTIASRGYPQGGAGSEVQFGDGIIGVVAEAQKPIRISGLLRGMLHARAVARRAMEIGWSPDKQVPLPGLENPESQLGVPLVVRGELIGVLCIESETPYRFHEDDKTTIEMLGSHLAVAIQNMQLREKEDAMQPPRVAPAAPAPAPSRNGKRREVTYYRGEEVLMVDGEYLIRSLPARILWKLLTTKKKEGRCEFTNRELRLDKSLNLPDYKDNLETRLLLLRRRLEEKGGDLRLVPKGRGRFALETGSEFELEEKS